MPGRAAAHGHFASRLRQRILRGAGLPIRKIDAEAHHLHELERAGEGAEAPFIAMLGVFLLVAPLFLLVIGLVLAGIYIAG